MSEPKDEKNANRVDDESSAPTVTETQKQPGPDKEPDMVYPKGLQLVAILIALCLAVLLVALDQTIIATAIPRITDRFNSVQDIGWYGSVSLQVFWSW
jgi:uncharacterized protein HemX